MNVTKDPLLHQVLYPGWMLKPTQWHWLTPSGKRQGFGLQWEEHISLANLQWLAMPDGYSCPKTYDARHNPLYMRLALPDVQQHKGLLQLALLPLPRFVDLALRNPGELLNNLGRLGKVRLCER